MDLDLPMLISQSKFCTIFIRVLQMISKWISKGCRGILATFYPVHYTAKATYFPTPWRCLFLSKSILPSGTTVSFPTKHIWGGGVPLKSTAIIQRLAFLSFLSLLGRYSGHFLGLRYMRNPLVPPGNSSVLSFISPRHLTLAV